MAQPTLRTKDVIAALRRTHGKVFAAAEILGCDWSNLYRFVRKHPEVNAVIEVERGKQLDVTEMKLFQAIAEGAPWAICFYLKCQGKARGWIERAEITGANGAPLIAPDTVRALVQIFQEVNLIQDPAQRQRVFAERADKLLEVPKGESKPETPAPPPA